MNEFLEAAKYYHALGLHPIPVQPNGKRPLLPSWREFCERQPSLAEIETWWTNTPDANVALVLGRGTFAVDIDGPEGEAALALAGVVIPADAPISTTGKGRHIFFTGEARNAVGILPKVDVRSDGGYVVAPPSVHASGAKYTWARSLIDGTLPEVPPPLRELLDRPMRPAQGQGATDAGWLTVALAGAGEGQRDTTCTRLAGYLLGKGLPAEATESLLTAWADRCTPPFPADQVTKCVTSIARLEGDHEAPDPPARIGVLTRRALEAVRHPSANRATALKGLDILLDGGLQPGELTYLGGRPGTGKTALVLQIAREVARAGHGVLLVSREMTPPALVRRMLAQESLVRFRNLKTGQLEAIEWTQLEIGATRLAELPIWITSNASVVSIEHLTTTMEALEDEALGLVVVDYLQLLRAPVDIRERRAAVEYVSEELKRLAGRYNVPVLCLSSLSRPPKDAGRNWRPILSDLRESGELEHDADNVLFLHWDRESDLRELSVAKQRDGILGKITLRFDEFMRFTEVGHANA